MLTKLIVNNNWANTIDQALTTIEKSALFKLLNQTITENQKIRENLKTAAEQLSQWSNGADRVLFVIKDLFDQLETKSKLYDQE